MTVPLDDRGLLLGDGLFETVLAQDGGLIRLEAHLDRMAAGCAVLGLPLINAQEKATFFHAVLYGFGSSVGFTLVLLMFAGLRERLALARVPSAFGGAPISFMTASLLALAFMGFSGLNIK